VLIFLLVVVGGSLALFALRATIMKSQAGFGIWSRETLLLVNNLLLSVAAAMILLGTLYPMFVDALTGAKLSVGPPYFNAMFVPLMAVLMAVAAVGMLTRWKDTPIRWLARMLLPVLVVSLLAGLAAAALHGRSRWVVAGVCLLAAWIVLASLRDIFDKTRHTGLLKGLSSLGRGYWGMHLAHLGFATCALGAVLATAGSVEQDLRMAPGTAVTLDGYRFLFDGTNQVLGANYVADHGVIHVERDGVEVATLYPEKRVYRVQQSATTEAGIQGGFIRDLFVALGEPLADGAWSVRVQIKPFVRWIWMGALLMALGGFLAASDRRYRARRERSAQDISARDMSTQDMSARDVQAAGVKP
jgi:cytochrome c-type biogenesis protein CcmF